MISFEEIVETITPALNGAKIHPASIKSETNLLDLSSDSLLVAQIQMDLEEKYGVDLEAVPTETLLNIPALILEINRLAFNGYPQS